MYGLFPVVYPIAKLLDSLLGTNHGLLFNRAGLKTLVILHERLSYSSAERLKREEVAIISSVLDLNEAPISSIMTPISKLFTLSLDDDLNDITRYNIVKAGYSNIPIYSHRRPTTFVGALAVKSLVALNFEEGVTVGQLSLDSLPVVRPDATWQRAVSVFRDRKVQIALVTENGTLHGEPLGIVTARDVMEKLFGA
jgi:metal transporter CNNM